MRNILVFVLTLSIVSCTRKTVQEPEINVINVSALSFFKEATGSSIPLSATEGNIVLAFGSPDSISKDTAEVNNDPFTEWIYQGAVIYLQAGRMVNIDLRTSSFGFVFMGTVIKVGENISKLKANFPLSFSLKSAKQLMIGLNYNGEPIDSHILFDFDKAGRITAISLLDKTNVPLNR
jgi:hypothetical protein